MKSVSQVSSLSEATVTRPGHVTTWTSHKTVQVLVILYRKVTQLEVHTKACK